MTDDSPANCRREHKRSEANTYRFGTRRQCKSCRRFWWRTYARRRRGTLPSAYQVRTEPEELT